MGLWKIGQWKDMAAVFRYSWPGRRKLYFIYQYSYFVLLIRPQYTKSEKSSVLLLSYNGFSFSVILQQVEKETFTFFFFLVFFSLKQKDCQCLLLNSILIIPLHFFPFYPLLFLPFLQLTAFPHSKVSSSKLGYLLPKYFLAICQCFQH